MDGDGLSVMVVPAVVVQPPKVAVTLYTFAPVCEGVMVGLELDVDEMSEAVAGDVALHAYVGVPEGGVNRHPSEEVT